MLSKNSSLAQLSDLLQKKEISALALSNACLSNIEKNNTTDNSAVFKDNNIVGALQAQQEAQKLDDDKPDPKKSLWGLPLVLSDTICVNGLINSAGSEALENFASIYDATIINLLKDAGAIVVAKTKQDEFNLGFSPIFKDSKIGDVAKLVANKRVPAGLDLDTAASTRVSAAMHGCMAIKPSYGFISRNGVIPSGTSLEQLAVVANSAEDCALILDNVVAHDAGDSTSVEKTGASFSASVNKYSNLEGVSLAYDPEYLEQCDAESVAIFKASLEKAKKLGAKVSECKLVYSKLASSVHLAIWSAELSSNLTKFDGIRYGKRVENPQDLQDLYVGSRSISFGFNAQLMSLLGTHVLSEAHFQRLFIKATKLRTLMSNECAELLKNNQALCYPSSPCANLISANDKTKLDPLYPYSLLGNSLLANITGLPALSTPIYKQDKSPACGIGLMGAMFDDSTILGIAKTLMS